MKTSKARVLLCVVMTLLMLTVAMSVSAETATVGTVTTATGDGDIVVTVSVSGVSGKATIMVYPEGVDLATAKSDPMNNIKYIDEATAANGEAVFTFAVAAGQYNMTVGGGGVTSTTTTLDATVNTAPVYAEAAVAVAKDSGEYAGEVIGTYAATDADGHALAYTINEEAVTAGFAVDAATGAVSFTGTLADGEYVVVVTATDIKGAAATCTVTINVTTPNAAPVLTVAESVEAEAGVYEEAQVITAVEATDANDTELTYSVDTEGFAVVDGNLVFTGILTKGTYVVTITVSDDEEATDSATVTVTVPNRAPAFGDVNTEITVDEGTTAIGTFAATDADGDALTYELSANSDAEAGFAVDNAGNVTYDGYLEPGTYYIQVNVTDGEAEDSISLKITVVGKIYNTAPVFEAETAEAALAVGEYTTAQELVTIAAVDAENDTLTYSVDADGFAVDAEGKVTFTGEITEDLTATITVRDAMYEDSYVLTVTATNDGFAAVSVAAIETVVKVSDQAADFTAAVGIPETVTVKYMYGEVEKTVEIAIDWDFESVEADGLENADTVNGTLNADALAAAGIVLGEVSDAVSFKYERVTASFDVITINQYDAKVLNVVPGKELAIVTEYVGLGEATYAYKMVELNNVAAENEIPAEEEFAPELSIMAPAAREGKRLVIYAKDSVTGEVLKVTRYVYGYIPYQVSVTLDGQARYWNIKKGDSVEAAVVVTDANTGKVVKADTVTYYLMKGEEVVQTSETGIFNVVDTIGAYIVKAEAKFGDVIAKGQRTLYVMDTAFTAIIKVNDIISHQFVAENSNIKVDAVVDFVPEEGLNWYTDIVAYNTALNSINVDEWNNVIDGTTVDIKAGTAGTKKVVALFKTVGADVAEIVRTNTMYVRNAKNLYVITGITRDGNPYTLGAIGDDTIELAVSSAEGPGTLEDLTMEVKILEYRYETVIWTSGDVAATETVNVAKADWFDQIVDPAEGKPAIRNAVRVQFVLKDASGAEVGSTKRVLYL